MVKLSTYNHLDSYSKANKSLGSSNSKVIGNNTKLVRTSGGNISVTLHGHTILTYRQDGTMKLWSRGYKTSTTKDRLNRYTPSDFKVFQRQGVWYAKRGDERQRFQEGMLVRE